MYYFYSAVFYQIACKSSNLNPQSVYILSVPSVYHYYRALHVSVLLTTHADRVLHSNTNLTQRAHM